MAVLRDLRGGYLVRCDGCDEFAEADDVHAPAVFPTRAEAEAWAAGWGRLSDGGGVLCPECVETWPVNPVEDGEQDG